MKASKKAKPQFWCLLPLERVTKKPVMCNVILLCLGPVRFHATLGLLGDHLHLREQLILGAAFGRALLLQSMALTILTCSFSKALVSQEKACKAERGPVLILTPVFGYLFDLPVARFRKSPATYSETLPRAKSIYHPKTMRNLRTPDVQ